MASPSSSMRQQAPNVRRSLLSKMKLVQDFVCQGEPSDESERIQYLEKGHANMDSVSGCLSRCQELVKSWSVALNTMADAEAQKAEEALYAKTVSDPNDGLEVLAEKLHDLQSELKAKIARLAKANMDSRQDNDSNSRDSRGEREMMKIEKIALPKFNGDLFKFQGFWTTFCAAIHDRGGMTKTVKLAHLMALLEGKAKEAVDGFDMTDDNYDLVVDILHHRFNRRNQRMVTMLYGRLNRVPCSGKTCEDKRRTFDECEKIFRQLEQAGQDIDANQSLILQLLSKFPAGMVRELEKTYGLNPESALSELRAAIEQLITDLEMSYGFHQDVESFRESSTKEGKLSDSKSNWATKHNDSSWKKKSGGYADRETGSTSTMGAVSEPDESNYLADSRCCFCNGQHFNSRCKKYPTVAAREKRLRELKLCVKCARKHNAGLPRDKCTRYVRCFYCRTVGEHYTALCPERFSGTGTTVLATVEGHGESDTDNEDAKSNSDESHDGGQPSGGSTDNGQPSGGSADGLAVLASGGQKALFLTAKVDAVNLDSGVKCRLRVVLDTLSTCSYIVASRANKLGLESLGSKTTFVKTFSAKKAAEVPTQRVKFGLVRTDGKGMLEIDALSVKLISDCEVLPTKIPAYERRMLDKLSGDLSLADDLDDDVRTIDVLLGADYVWDVLLGGRREISSNSSIGIVPTIFGSMLCGRVDADDRKPSPTLMCIAAKPSCTPGLASMSDGVVGKTDKELDIDEYWRLETIGITEPVIDHDDEIAMRDFRNSVRYENGRYSVKWPFLEKKKEELPSNFSTAVRRFKALDARLQKDQSLMKSYKEVIADQMAKGVIEKVPEAEVRTENPTHYLPHHPVIKSSSATTKVRIVYDASSKARKEDVSLNECLRKGPTLLPDLCQLLVRFRTSPTVVVSDVEKAFLQIMLQPGDRDVTRFLWYADPESPDVAKLAFYRFCRVAFGLKSSPFLLGATIQYHLERNGTQFARHLVKDVYVDNVISGVETDTVLEYYGKVKSLFRDAGMNLQEFCSNSHKLMQHVPECDRVRNTDVKVLGLQWDSLADDTLRIPKSSKFDEFSAINSKRGVLKCGASIFDPLGVFQPVTFQAKLFLQKLWVLGVSWDEPLPDSTQSEWQEVCSQIRPIFEMRLQRFIGEPTADSSLVVFSDASSKGYGAAVYLRSWNSSLQKWSCRLVYAKSRLAPPKKAKSAKAKSVQVSGEISIPRLELLGAVVATRAASFVRDALGLPGLNALFFIDSESVLHWLRSQKDLTRFVRRRIDEMQQVKNGEFCYVRTADNPADFLTRGKSADDLAVSDLWWRGPPWLSEEKEEWPRPRVPDVSTATLKEMVKEAKMITVCHAAVSEQGPFTVLRINPSQFSSLNRLLRVTCIVVKFLKLKLWNKRAIGRNFHPAVCQLFDQCSEDAAIVDTDMETVMTMWVRRAQECNFGEAIEALSTGGVNSLVMQLGLKMDSEGLLRSHGRFAHANLPENAKFPILLPKNHVLSELVVRDIHFRLKHSGPTHTLCELRQSFWIPHGRAYVKAVLGRCIVCRKGKNGPPFALPNMPPYPVERVSQAVPFQTTGVDYFGPLNVKVHGNVQKMWVSLFTCLCTRAVHLEPVLDCSSGEFLSCFMRFAGRRGVPVNVISDNAAHFRLMKILGKTAWRKQPTDPDLMSYLASAGVKWSFIIELAPWQGGHYERLVGSVKAVLKIAVGRRLLSWSDLVTLLVETEAIVNSRPITYVGDDPDSHFRVLRPVDFLTHQPVSVDSNVPDLGGRNLSEGAKLLLKIWKRREIHLQKLWQAWYDQYILSLRERCKTLHHKIRGSIQRSPRPGEVVLVRNDDAPRGSWKLARVKSLIHSRDGKVRAAELVLPNRITIRRTVNFLYPLEVDGGVPEHSSVCNSPANTEEDEPFMGFSNEDIRATRDVLARYDLLSDDEDGSSVSADNE